MNEPVTTFEQLDAWQGARSMTRRVYSLTRQSDLAKDFGLTGQIQRASVSVMTNIAEGFGRQHLQEKLQFYNIARGSVTEVRSLLYVIEDNYLETATQAGSLREEAIRVGQIVSGLIRATESRRLGQRTARFIACLFGWLIP